MEKIKEKNLDVIRYDGRTEKFKNLFGVTDLQAEILKAQGYKVSDKKRLKTFLHPDLEHALKSVHLGGDTEKSVKLFHALTKGSNVVVYGDYDTDGIMSIRSAIGLVTRTGASHKVCIPSREENGYGFHVEAAKKIETTHPDLVVILDCGTNDVEALEILRKADIPFIVFDHHIGAENCFKDSIINPNVVSDSSDDAKCLCGAAVFWVWMWQNDMMPKEDLIKYLQFTALALTADCMSMETELNRALVRKGLEVIRTTPVTGLRMLIEDLELSYKQILQSELSMKVIPVLNAAGRIGSASEALSIFYNYADIVETAEKVRQLVLINEKKKAMAAEVRRDLEDMKSPEKAIYFSDKWNNGVLSSAATSLCMNEHRPICLVTSVERNGYRMFNGSIRLPEDSTVSAVDLLSEFKDQLARFGGHKSAAGFSIDPLMWGDFQERFEAKLQQVRCNDRLERVIFANPATMDYESLSQIEAIGPFGVTNPAPKFYFPVSLSYKLKPIGKDGRHFKIIDDNNEFTAFYSVGKLDNISGVIYTIGVNRWNGNKKMQFIVDKIVEKD